MNTIQMKAFAKVNLGLDVVRRREDGYHEVRMIMQTIQLYDRVFLERKKQPGIILKTNLSFLPVDESNIAYRAAAMLYDLYNMKDGIRITIEKHIPVAAGMAGGSTDGAAVLYGMNRLFGLGLSKKKLMEIGVRLGADVPYCIMRGTVLAEGIGEILTPLSPMPPCYILVAKPPVSVSTKHVYENLKLDRVEKHPDIDRMIGDLEKKDLENLVSGMENVLETVTIPEHPEIARLKMRMIEEGALNALMSGSGPTVFGIFDDREKGMHAKEVLHHEGPAKQIYLVEPYNIIE